MAIIHVHDWNKFKELVAKLNPTAIIYSIINAPLSNPPIGLKIFFAMERTYYIFYDYAEGQALRKTKIPVYGEKTKASIDEGEIKKFLYTQLKEGIELISADILAGM